MIKQPVRTNVSDLIKTTMGSQFVIPVYQRSYTWRPEAETARLMGDIQDLLKDRSATHFLGIIISMETDVSAMFKEIQIVDGQQRLTTSFIFLLALKRVALEHNNENIAGMIDDYYLYNRHSSQEALLRLKPAVGNDDTFAHLYYGSYKDLDHNQKETPVYRNYDYIYRRVEEFSKSWSLVEILDTLGRLDVLSFPLSEDDNAQQIFESINSTGAPLTSSDLIRNYILMNDSSGVQERNYELYWQPLEKRIPDPARLEEFFRCYLAGKTYSLPARRDTYQAFKSWWNASDASKEDKLRDIAANCRYYDAIYNGPYEDAEVEAALQDFRYTDSRTPAPFLLGMFDLKEKGTIRGADLAKVIRLVDTYLTRRALLGLDVSMMGRYFPHLLQSVLHTFQPGHSSIYEVTKLCLVNYNRGRALAMPTDKQIRSTLKETNAYSLLCIRPVLERIEHHGATAKVDTSDLNIEHIMPQHPNAWWKKNSGAKDEDEYSFYANLIGNLTLCAQYDNTRIGNEDFDYKKKVLSRTLHIRMNSGILNSPSWGIKEIRQRCETMANEIIAIYPYESAHERAKPKRQANPVILLNTPSVNARAMDRGTQGVEVLSGSSMRPYGQKEMRSMQGIYRSLMEKGVIYEDENGTVQFARSWRFTDRNRAAQFLMHRGGDNTDAWTYEDGSPLKETQAAKAGKEIREPKGDPTVVKQKNTGGKAVSSPQAAENSKSRKPHQEASVTQGHKSSHSHSASEKKTMSDPGSQQKKKENPGRNDHAKKASSHRPPLKKTHPEQNKSVPKTTQPLPQASEKKMSEPRRHSGNGSSHSSRRPKTMAEKMGMKPQVDSKEIKKEEETVRKSGGASFLLQLLGRKKNHSSNS